MKILFICKSSPWGRGGASYATHAYLKAFSELSNGNIDVILPDDEFEYEKQDVTVSTFIKTKRRTKLFQVLSVITGCMHRYSNQIRDCINDGNYDVIVYNGSATTSGSIKKAINNGITVVTIHHNFEYEYFRDNTPSFLLRFLFSHHVRRNERRSYLKSNYNLFLSNDDLKRFHNVYGDNDGKNSCIGVFEYKPIPKLKKNNKSTNLLTIAITGSLCTVQGVDGIIFFFRELFPQLPNGIKVIISGRSPQQSIVDYCDKYENVELIANPNNMNDVINQADIYLCPTRLGGGVKLRVMDGLRLGIPVVTHSCSARGYEMFYETSCLSVFSDSDGFKAAFDIIVGGINDGSITKDKVFNKYNDYFSFEAGLQRVKELFS